MVEYRTVRRKIIIKIINKVNISIEKKKQINISKEVINQTTNVNNTEVLKDYHRKKRGIFDEDQSDELHEPQLPLTMKDT